MKLQSGRPRGQSLRVAPRTGAWIETQARLLLADGCASPPARGRGLKRFTCGVRSAGGRSPPARGRGLKPASAEALGEAHSVAPRTGAWIETVMTS